VHISNLLTNKKRFRWNSIFLNILLKGFELGKSNGSTPQNTATVLSLIYLENKFLKNWLFKVNYSKYPLRNRTSHPGVSPNCFVNHKRIIIRKTIATEHSLQLNNRIWHVKLFYYLYFGFPRSLYCLASIAFKLACTSRVSGSARHWKNLTKDFRINKKSVIWLIQTLLDYKVVVTITSIKSAWWPRQVMQIGENWEKWYEKQCLCMH
jgi:hypothetical protein